MNSTAERTEFWVGAVVLIAAAGFGLWSTAGQGLVSVPGAEYELVASFPNVDGVEAGTDVRLAGVRIGRVASVRLNPDTYLADARLRLPQEIRVPTDSAALIQSDGLLGGAYIELQPGGAADDLAPGDEIEDVQGAVSLISLMMKFVDSQSDEGGE